jgi:predicted DNA binding CopG/RHH family protein
MPGKRSILKCEASKMKKIPKFKTDQDAAIFWQTHSFEDYFRDTTDSEIAFVKKPKKTIALRLDPEDIKTVEHLAQRKGLSYTSLLRMWIKEHLAQEAENRA